MRWQLQPPLLSFPPSLKLPPTAHIHASFSPSPTSLTAPATSFVFPSCHEGGPGNDQPQAMSGPPRRRDLKGLASILYRGKCVNFFPSSIRPPVASRLLVFFVCVFNDKVNTNRKNKAFWLHIMLVVVWHLRAIMGNRDSDRPQTQLCFSGQWSLVELSLQACSGGLDLTWRC